MTSEDKQALIEYCKEVQGNNPESSDAYKVISIALAALTAKPVNLSNCRTLWYDHDDLSAEVKCIPVKDIKKAIRAAGYEVQE